ncbi:MAG TPA: exosortase Q [Methylibium sp.]|uniref:exosortase Q n=1 Tax=Methylibium sp. TaxID=2067992 RepID=UPI002DB8B4DD|nr:exosortase Q [Methylibium sp.]HEU4458242.1 exosortase Q [Methylibium sp.]
MTTIALARRGAWPALDRLPPWAWLALQAAALWPHALWAARRAADGSDDPLGLVALAVLAAAVARAAPRLLGTPRPGWLAASLGLTAAATAAWFALPPLAGALLAALAFGSALAAWLPSHAPRAPLAGLVLLALPVIASLQFYAGWPLRVLTAELSTWALRAAGFVAERSGAAMTVDGRLVIVDAPCSGVQLAWCAYFCACVAGWWSARGDAIWLRRLPLVGVFVLAGNALRNSLLVGGEASGGLSEAAHQAIGLGITAAVGAAVIAWTTRSEAHAHRR